MWDGSANEEVCTRPSNKIPRDAKALRCQCEIHVDRRSYKEFEDLKEALKIM